MGKSKFEKILETVNRICWNPNDNSQEENSNTGHPLDTYISNVCQYFPCIEAKQSGRNCADYKNCKVYNFKSKNDVIK